MSRSRSRRSSLLLLGTAALACTGRALDDGATDTPATTAAATSLAPLPTTGDGGSTGPGGSTTGHATTSDGAPRPDAMPTLDACDPWRRDCPEGQKCAAYSTDGAPAWNALKCVPVVRAPDDVGEPCEALGTGFDGLDTCADGQMCWEVDPGTRVGVCLAQCVGSPEAPACADPTSGCSISGDGGVLPLCFPGCDPLAQDCPAGQICIPWYDGSTFHCSLDPATEKGEAFALCGFHDGCEPGLLCLPPALAVECDPEAPGCCLPVCDLSAPLDCPGAGQQCLPWYAEGMAPPGFENVGACALP